MNEDVLIKVMNASGFLKRFIIVIVILLGLFLNWDIVSDYYAIVVAGFLTYLLCELY